MTKPTKWHVRPAKTQISLGIRPVWWGASLSVWRNLASLATHWEHSEDSDQTGRMPRLIWIFARRTDHFVGFVVRWLKYRNDPKYPDRPVRANSAGPGQIARDLVRVYTVCHPVGIIWTQLVYLVKPHCSNYSFAVRMKKTWVLSYWLSA